MPKIAYISKKINEAKLTTIDLANEIIREYQDQGYDLTLRQLYYQFVSRGHIPNSDREYRNLGATISDGRLLGLIDWEAITDRTRNLRSVNHWDGPESIVRAVADQFRIDKWESQPCRIEVWVEKDALGGILDRVCTRLDVPWFSCRGYTSQSEMWAAAQRLDRFEERGQQTVILHLGDHDPSGIDMSRDIEDRLGMFMKQGTVHFTRIALNRDQIDLYNPPPNPAKLSDARAASYVERHGDESWELDALEPSVIDGLIESYVQELLDEDQWREKVIEENAHRTRLRHVSRSWEKVASFVEYLYAQ